MTALDKLSQIIPPDQALANKALSVALQQITNIAFMNLPQLAQAVSNVQTNYGLPLITAQTSAVSPAAANAVVNAIGKGTGPNGTVTINDSMGTVAGVVSANAMANTVSIVSTMDLSNLTGIYNDMTSTADGTYGPPTGPIIIPTGAAAGTYDNLIAAFGGQESSGNTGGPGLIPATTTTVIPDIISAYPTQTANLNTNWNNMSTQLSRETAIQLSASVSFANLTPNSTSSIYSFVLSLPSYGQDTAAGGSAQFIQAVADKNTIGGQAIIATMRQGQSNINSTGISTSNNIPVEPASPPPQANLLPAQYPYPQPIVT